MRTPLACHFRRSIAPGLFAFTILSIQAAEGPPVFTFGFEGVPGRVVGQPGEVKTFEVFVTLTTANNPSPDGAQGWLFIFMVEGWENVKATLKGIKVQTIFNEDDDQDPETPPIHHDPYEEDLGDRSIFRSGVEVHTCTLVPLKQAVALLTVLRNQQQETMVLQPNGTQRVAGLTLQVTVPESAVGVPLTLGFERVEACGFNELYFPGEVTIGGKTLLPGFETVTTLAVASPFRRGDFNSDDLVDITDAIDGLGYLFFAGAAPGCRDAADTNDDGRLDIADPIFFLASLTGAGSGAGLPVPEPSTCGLDPSPDSLSCLSSPCQIAP